MRFKYPDVRELFQAVEKMKKKRNDILSTGDKGLKEVVMNIAEGCNLTCPYCFAAQGKYGATTSAWMSSKVAHDSLTYLLEKYPSVENIKVFGGEPFMNIPAISQVMDVKEAHESSLGHTITVGAVTNMTVFSKKIVDLCKQGFKFAVSIDGPQNIHDANRRFINGRGSFDTIVRNIEKYDKSGFRPTNIDSVFTPLHLEKGLSMAQMAKYLVDTFGIDKVNISPVYYENDFINLGDFTKVIREQAFQFAYSEYNKGLSRSDWAKGVLDRILQTRTIGWCSLGESTITVMTNGDVLPCYTLATHRKQWLIGNVGENNKFIKVPTSTADILKNANPRTNFLCSSCEIRSICWGCPGATYSTTKKFSDRIPYRCAFRIGSIEGFLKGKIDSEKQANGLSNNK